MNRTIVASRQLVRQVAIVLGLSILGGAATMAFHPRGPAWFVVMEVGDDAVTPELVRERWNGDVQWVDARSLKAFARNHREGAISLNEEQWNDRLYEHFDRLAAAGKPIVVYCDGARRDRSRAVAEKLRELGIPDVFYLQGNWRR